MGEKKEITVRLSTVVCLFIILALVVALGVVYYFGFVKENNANNVVANGEGTEINNTEKTDGDLNKEENSTQIIASTQEDANKFVPLSIYTANKKVVPDNREGYYISKEDGVVDLFIKEGKVYFTSFQNNEFWSDYFEINENDIKVPEIGSAEITGFTKKVVDAEICSYQTFETIYFVFLMEDGTLEYSSVKNMLTNLTTEGKVENVSNIQRIHECSIEFTDMPGNIDTVVALDYENNMYDIGYILSK